MRDFDRWMWTHQSEWRKDRVSTDAQGTFNKKPRPWILPVSLWEESLWPPLRSPGPDSIVEYLRSQSAEKHTGSNNLSSSWVACANLYFPFRWTSEGRSLLAAFLRENVSDAITSVDRIELEYAEDGPLHPAPLLGEAGGNRGAGQTSPDIAILVNGEMGIVLTESKLAEHSFYPCSARTSKSSPDRPANPDRGRCMDPTALVTNPGQMCHQVTWGRKYWDRLKGAISEAELAKLKACPAALGGYQLFRQQALAEGYTAKYDLVVSAVAYDARNDDLINSLRSTGVQSFPAGWAKLFKGKAGFSAWTHQAWVAWVREHQGGDWTEWLEWIEERYDYRA